MPGLSEVTSPLLLHTGLASLEGEDLPTQVAEALKVEGIDRVDTHDATDDASTGELLPREDILKLTENPLGAQTP